MSVHDQQLSLLLEGQLRNIKQLLDLNDQLMVCLGTENLKKLNSLFNSIKKTQVMVVRADTDIKRFIELNYENNTGIFNSYILSLFKDIKDQTNKNKMKLDKLFVSSKQLLQQNAHSLKQARTGTKMMQTFKALNGEQPSIEFNV